MNKLLKNNKGVTLIALVVTIVILIILAGVSMSMVLGDNGIFIQAKTAANKMASAEANTQEAMKELQNEIEQNINSPTAPELKEEIPNAPKKIEGMTPIKFVEPTDSEKGQVVDTDWNDNNWYNYKQCSGTQFDPNIINVFLQILDNNYDEIREIMNEY